MVLVWDLTIAIMNGSEREGRAGERERQKGATGSSLHTTLSFFFDVMFHKALCFQFIYLVKGLGAHQLLCDFSRCKEGSEQL